jgi:hypothetical protein
MKWKRWERVSRRFGAQQRMRARGYTEAEIERAEQHLIHHFSLATARASVGRGRHGPGTDGVARARYGRGSRRVHECRGPRRERVSQVDSALRAIPVICPVVDWASECLVMLEPDACHGRAASVPIGPYSRFRIRVNAGGGWRGTT